MKREVGVGEMLETIKSQAYRNTGIVIEPIYVSLDINLIYTKT